MRPVFLSILLQDFPRSSHCHTYPDILVEEQAADGVQHMKDTRTPVFPEGWKDQFGLPFYEHKQSMQINTFDGYAVYAIKDGTPMKKLDDDNGGTENV